MKTQTAYSLIEVMVALALAAILAMVALPSMGVILANNRITTKSIDFVRALNYTRGEAISHAKTMSIEPAGAWGNGWQVKDEKSTDDDKIKAAINFDDDITIDMVNGPSSLSALQYDSRGRLTLSTWVTSIKFWVSNKNYPQLDGREITIRPIGTVSIKRCLKYPCT